MKREPPGKIKSADHDLIMMICTAGHVDHGKTSLVRQLTGCETDRLRVEKERGLTIELGFAPCMLKGNLSVGIVDVPGHEKFVKNMVSGIPGIDLAMLVIAADDGVMPQTVEHMQIMELLGVRNGIVALTKIDLVTEDRVGLRTQEIEDFLAGTSLEGSPICPVSSETFDGYFDFYDTLVERIKAAKKARANGVFRMPIERTFSQQGFGSILSGIPLDGTIEIGTQVELVPGGQKGRIRGIQCFGRTAESGGYGQCLALNVPDLGKTNPDRGQVVCIPGYLKASRTFQVRLRTIANMDKPIKNAQEIKFHTGTSEESGKIFLLEAPVLGPRQEGLATVVLQNEVGAAVLDKFIIRQISPATTVAGGEILAVSESEKRPKKKRMATKLRAYQFFFDGVDLSSPEGARKKIEYFLSADRKPGGSAAEISKGTLLPRHVVLETVAGLVKDERLMALGAQEGEFYVHAQSYRECMCEVDDWITDTVNKQDAISVKVSDLRKSREWPPLLWQKILDDLAKGDKVSVQGNIIALKGAESKFNEEERRILDQLREIYENTGYKSPRPDELPAMVKAPQDKVDRMLEYLCNEGKMVRLSRNVVLVYEKYKHAQDLVVEAIKEKGSLNSADFKYMIDSTRKYALAILDFLDGKRITVCLPNHDRKLSQDFEKNLL